MPDKWTLRFVGVTGFLVLYVGLHLVIRVTSTASVVACLTAAFLMAYILDKADDTMPTETPRERRTRF